MTKDPFKLPIPLAVAKGGPWEYIDESKKVRFTGDSFWQTARRLWQFRVNNNLPRATYEEAQIDLLIAKRKKLGLPLILRGQNQPVTTDSAKLYMARYEKPTQSSGCKGCGKKTSKPKLLSRGKSIERAAGKIGTSS